jgi:hypothetical protein
VEEKEVTSCCWTKCVGRLSGCISSLCSVVVMLWWLEKVLPGKESGIRVYTLLMCCSSS